MSPEIKDSVYAFFNVFLVKEEGAFLDRCLRSQASIWGSAVAFWRGHGFRPYFREKDVYWKITNTPRIAFMLNFICRLIFSVICFNATNIILSSLFVIRESDLIYYSRSRIFQVFCYCVKSRFTDLVSNKSRILDQCLISLIFSLISKAILLINPRTKKDYMDIVSYERQRSKTIPFKITYPSKVTKNDKSISLPIPDHISRHILSFSTEKEIFKFSKTSKKSLAITSSKEAEDMRIKQIFPQFLLDLAASKDLPLNEILSEPPIENARVFDLEKNPDFELERFDITPKQKRTFYWGRDHKNNYLLFLRLIWRAESGPRKELVAMEQVQTILFYEKTKCSYVSTLCFDADLKSSISRLTYHLKQSNYHEDYITRLIKGEGCGSFYLTRDQEGPRFVQGLPVIELWREETYRQMLQRWKRKILGPPRA